MSKGILRHKNNSQSNKNCVNSQTENNNQPNTNMKTKTNKPKSIQFSNSVVDYDGPRSQKTQPNPNVVPGKSKRNEGDKESYASLIVRAISSTSHKMMTLGQIYDWFIKNASKYGFKCDPKAKGWRNSIRHNLSLHRKFKRIPSARPRSAAYWRIDNGTTLGPEEFFNRYFSLFPETLCIFSDCCNNRISMNGKIDDDFRCRAFAKDLMSFYYYFMEILKEKIGNEDLPRAKMYNERRHAHHYPMYREYLNDPRFKYFIRKFHKNHPNGYNRVSTVPLKRYFPQFKNASSCAQSPSTSSKHSKSLNNYPPAETIKGKVVLDKRLDATERIPCPPRGVIPNPSNSRHHHQDKTHQPDFASRRKDAKNKNGDPICSYCIDHSLKHITPTNVGTMTPSVDVPNLQLQQNLASLRKNAKICLGSSSNSDLNNLEDEGICMSSGAKPTPQSALHGLYASEHKKDPQIFPHSLLSQDFDLISLPPPMQFVNPQPEVCFPDNPFIQNLAPPTTRSSVTSCNSSRTSVQISESHSMPKNNKTINPNVLASRNEFAKRSLEVANAILCYSNGDEGCYTFKKNGCCNRTNSNFNHHIGNNYVSRRP